MNLWAPEAKGQRFFSVPLNKKEFLSLTSADVISRRFVAQTLELTQ
jgi:hypothetical protein